MKILITGGSSGLGKRVLEKLQDSNEIHFTYNNSKNEAKKLTKRFKNTYSYKCDFTVEKELEEFLSKIEKIEFDILINNYYSGKFLDKHFIKSNSSEYIDAFKNNISPVIEITKTLLKTFKRKKKGLIISISSQSITKPPVGSGIYSSVKSVIEQLSKIWNSENERFGITSIIISPSFMRTNLTSEMDERIIELFFENSSNRNEISKISNEVMKIINKYFL